MNPNPDIDGNLRIARAIRGELSEGFERLPLALNRFAELAMKQAAEAQKFGEAMKHSQGVVNAARRGPLQSWAKKKRKAKAAAASRRRNREGK